MIGFNIDMKDCMKAILVGGIIIIIVMIMNVIYMYLVNDYNKQIMLFGNIFFSHNYHKVQVMPENVFLFKHFLIFIRFT